MTHRVLVVDDDREMVRTLCDILRLHGWDVQGLFSGEDAVAAVRDHAFSFVLMDVRMGGVNGVDALRAMKAVRPSVRVVLMTAYSAADLVAQAERGGALRVLAKPVAPASVLEMLATMRESARSVLVVDDEPAFLHTLANVLRQHDYTVFEATSIESAIEQLERVAPGAVVLDLILDGMQDEESVVAIKRVSPAVALILYSGHGAALDVVSRRLEPRGICGTLHKPFPPEALLELLGAIFA